MGMSSIASGQSTTVSVAKLKHDIFQDLPILDKNIRLTVIELRNSDKQIVNELVYRWCRILTRTSKNPRDQLPELSDSALKELRKVLIVDMIGAINPIRLATVMKRDERRMSMIALARGCKINSTYVTLQSLIGACGSSNSVKLVVIYQDEFFILKTLSLLKESLKKSSQSQFLLIVPRLDRQEHDILNLTTSYQVLRADFSVNRKEIKPAPPEQTSESYQEYLNQVCFHRHPSVKTLPDKVLAGLCEDGLNLVHPKESKKNRELSVDDGRQSSKRLKADHDTS